MGKDKQKRFDDVARFQNVFEYTDFKNSPKPRGQWHREVFRNQNPIVLELACGKGEYTLNLARKYPNKNFVGIDIKGSRLWRGAKTALEEPLPNVRFIRMFIDHLDEYFEPDEVSEIWILFPDPYLKMRKSRKRLTSPRFLNLYRKILKRNATIHLKTDSEELYAFTHQVIQSGLCRLIEKVDNVYLEKPEDPVLTIQTFYEKKHLHEGKTIRYTSFQLI